MTEPETTDHMPDPMRVAAGKDWSNKDVTLLLLGDVHRRFDSVDRAVQEIREEQRQLATKQDLAEIHHRIDGMEKRIEPLEAEADAQKAIELNRSKIRASWVKTVGVLASLAVVAGVVLTMVVTFH